MPKVNTLSLYYISVLIVVTIVFNAFFGFAVNVSNSLPYKVFLIDKISTPSVGNYISFKAPLNTGFPEDIIMTKQILAGPGDLVSKKDANFYINHKWVSKAKYYSRDGEALILGPEGKLKQNQYYVGAPHPDSLDSRYQKMGWIHREQIIAVAYPIF